MLWLRCRLDMDFLPQKARPRSVPTKRLYADATWKAPRRCPFVAMENGMVAADELPNSATVNTTRPYATPSLSPTASMMRALA